jgi:hypothetical protein
MNGTVKRTQTQVLLEAVREKLGSVTDYAIGKTLQLHQQTISRYHAGTQQADAYACAKFAEVLERDPLEVIAQVEADSAKTDERRAFWAGFPSGLKRTALGSGLLLTSGFFALGLIGGSGTAEAAVNSHNVYYVKLSIDIK